MYPAKYVVNFFEVFSTLEHREDTVPDTTGLECV